ncbi:uncharacterized protein [Magallana gigas]|uniref:uncharacterized protein isoform X2 n=1 Tax=Magallana gigas TaxID=29159 RepID=UPI003340B4D2
MDEEQNVIRKASPRLQLLQEDDAEEDNDDVDDDQSIRNAAHDPQHQQEAHGPHRLPEENSANNYRMTLNSSVLKIGAFHVSDSDVLKSHHFMELHPLYKGTYLMPGWQEDGKL